MSVRENLWEEQKKELQSLSEYELSDNSFIKTHNMKLNSEPFNLIKEGKKIIEMRLNDEKRKLISVGDIIIFNEVEEKHNKLKVLVKDIHRYDDFYELYRNFSKLQLGYYENQIALPTDMEEYYSKSDIKKYGVIGIEIEVL